MANDISFEWTGLEAFMKKIQDQPGKLKDALPGAVFEEAEELIGDAKKETPVLHGHLRASGHVDLPTFDGDKVQVTAGFGGVAGTGNVAGETNDGDVGYAVIVHEDLTKNHEVGNAKFLENPFNERKEGMPERLANKINARMK